MNSNPPVFFTPGGTAYLKDPGVVLLAAPIFCVNAGLRTFLIGLDPEFETGYNDFFDARAGVSEQGATHSFAGEHLVQLAGQLCYLSLGARRTTVGENATYLRKILSSGHGSVLEHANYTLLFYGIDRACTHELVRHRAGMAYSQVSQRYVDGRHLRFCMPFEYQQREELTTSFEKFIDYAADTYANRTEELKLVFPQQPGEVATDWRKRIQSCARECLPNATEAPIIVTGNARSWRHVLSMRTAKAADVRIRRPMIRALQVLQAAAPDLFGDFRTFNLPDGSIGAEAEFPKP